MPTRTPAAPVPPNARNALIDRLIAKGLAPSVFVLHLNHSLTFPPDMELPPPWDLHSRLFRFPIEVAEPSGERPGRIGLMHPLLVDHPFVRRVAADLGMALDPQGAPNAYGVSKQAAARWWHAVDLVSAGLWRELLETRRFTTEEDIAVSVAYGLDYSPHGRVRDGYLNIAEARTIMAAIGAEAPATPESVLQTMHAPHPCRPEKGQVRWPINAAFGTNAATRAWGRILGIEAGWFARDHSGFLRWTHHGRDRHAAGDRTTLTEASGQSAFAF